MKLELHYSLGLDAIGNRVVRVTPTNSRQRGFSIQTNGNLAITHRNGICASTPLEVLQQVRRCGTKRQREMMEAAQ